jgi:uracil-DNA glycosylase
MKKKRPTFDINISPLQHVWLDVLGVNVPWLAKVSEQTQHQSSIHVAPEIVFELRPEKAPQASKHTSVQALTHQSPHQTDSTQPLVAQPNKGLGDLSEQIRACQACGLCQNRHQAVVGRGVQRPAIMIVGEAPSEQEDRLGLPFAGRSGELLDNMLAAIGHHRDRDVYLTHVVKCRSPSSRTPRPEEMLACQPFLYAEIEAVQPHLILAMGRSAAQALLGQDVPLETLREQVWSFNASIPLLVTYHPAFLLRRPIDKKRAWQDLQQARDLVVI